MTNGQKRQRAKRRKLNNVVEVLFIVLPRYLTIWDHKHPTTKILVSSSGGGYGKGEIARIALYNKNHWVITIDGNVTHYRKPDAVIKYLRGMELIGALG